jgi:hypothetical protein
MLSRCALLHICLVRVSSDPRSKLAGDVDYWSFLAGTWQAYTLFCVACWFNSHIDSSFGIRG